MKTRLIFVRHAEAEGNFNRVFHGWYDSRITEKGHKQAKAVAERLADLPVDIIYSSSLTRTLQTAQYIADIKKLPIIRTDKMKEINGGDWENIAWEVLPELYPNENYTWENEPHIHQMPNGENMEEFYNRLLKEVMDIIGQNKGRNVCIVTHGTAIRAMLCRFYGKSLKYMKNVYWHDNTSVTIVDYNDENDEFQVVLEGDIVHLGAELSTIQNQEWWKSYMESRQKNN